MAMLNRTLGVWLSIVLLLVVFASAVEGHPTRLFTVADDIQMSKFMAVASGGAGPVQFSPDGKYFVAVTERGIVETNLLEDCIWVWKTSDVLTFLHDTHHELRPAPVRLIQLAAPKGPVVRRIRWLEDPSRLMFLGGSVKGGFQLFEANVATGAVHSLTPEDQDVIDYDVRNGNTAYTVRNLDFTLPENTKNSTPEFITGTTLEEVLFPRDRYPERIMNESNRVVLWAIIAGKRFRVEDSKTHEPVPLYQWGPNFDASLVFALSPDGDSVVVIRAVNEIPPGWAEYKQKPGVPGSATFSSTQDFSELNDFSYVKSYVLLNLSTGQLKELVHAPEASFWSWWDARTPRWSSNSQRILLPNTFLPLDGLKPPLRDERMSRPCLTVFDLPTQTAECLLPLKAESEGAAERKYADFSSPDGRSVFVELDDKKTLHFRETQARWTQDETVQGQQSSAGNGLDIEVKESLNDPPVLFAKDRTSKQGRLLWDPNPQLGTIDLGEASILDWKDKSGHPWQAGLIKPPDFKPGVRYPLVIQTHGFFGKDHFLSYGSLPTAFAARELAAAGFVVVQMPDDLDGVMSTPQEAPRHVAGIESVVEKLDAEGLIDPKRVGLIGFSRTCYYVLSALTSSRIKYAAASITDGITYGYWMYLATVDRKHRLDADQVIGAAPFGSGLQQWIARSPEFNLYKVDAPLLIVTHGPEVTFYQWGEYATLRYLKKPVELFDLGGANYEHVLTSPKKRLASQGSTIDWFRFWLKGEEDPDPQKDKQYQRWRELRAANRQVDRN